MVVLSAGLVTKTTGRVLVARNFVELSRSRIEGLYLAFPKLISPISQCTFVETDSVRYLYQPFDEIFVVLITTKASNIVEDLDTLRLFAKVVPERCGVLNEEGVLASSFDLLFAFDEIVSLGYREHVSSHQINTFLLMESAEEQRAIERRKEQEKLALKEMRDKAMKIDKEKAALAKTGSSKTGFGSGGVSSSGGGSMGGMGSMSSSSSSSMGGGSSSAPYAVKDTPVSSSSSAPQKQAVGMKLGKAKPKATDLLAAMIKEGEVPDSPARGSPSLAAPASASASSASSAPAARGGGGAPVSLNISETLLAKLDREGTLESLEVKGSLNLLITDAQFSHVLARLKVGANAGYGFKTHPNISKEAFSDGSSPVLTLKDASRSFPVNTDLAVLRWKYNSSDEAKLPISVACWPTASGSKCDVTVEYNLRDPRFELNDLAIRIPVQGKVDIKDNQMGAISYESGNTVLVWKVEVVDDSNSEAILEFSIQGVSDVGRLFPIDVSFSSGRSCCELEVARVEMVEGAAQVPFSSTHSLVTEDYKVV